MPGDLGLSLNFSEAQFPHLYNRQVMKLGVGVMTSPLGISGQL